MSDKCSGGPEPEFTTAHINLVPCVAANCVLIDPLIGGKRPTRHTRKTGQGTCGHGMGCAPEESNLPRPIGSLCRKKLAFTTDRRVVKLGDERQQSLVR